MKAVKIGGCTARDTRSGSGHRLSEVSAAAAVSPGSIPPTPSASAPAAGAAPDPFAMAVAERSRQSRTPILSWDISMRGRSLEAGCPSITTAPFARSKKIRTPSDRPSRPRAGVISIVNNNMADALRVVSVERGHDPREFGLIAFGGAGPLHAVALAEELDVPEVVIPPIPGGFSALGLVGTDIRRDYAKTHFAPLAGTEPAQLAALWDEMIESAKAMLRNTGVPEDQWVFQRSADLRYARQAYELNVPLEGERVDHGSLKKLVDGYHERHAQTYGHKNEASLSKS